MRPNPLFASDDPDLVRELVHEHPWATLVTTNGAGLVASHYPVMLDEEAPDLTLLTHLGRPDDEVLEIDRGEVLIIVQGHHGYISPGWYSESERLVPTWNFTVAHLHGTPQILDCRAARGGAVPAPGSCQGDGTGAGYLARCPVDGPRVEAAASFGRWRQITMKPRLGCASFVAASASTSQRLSGVRPSS